MEEFIGAYTVVCSFRSVEDGFMWVFAGIYGLNVNSNRHLMGGISWSSQFVETSMVCWR